MLETFEHNNRLKYYVDKFTEYIGQGYNLLGVHSSDLRITQDFTSM